jgi:RNA polymerase sigma-70 factor (ECF subfamily)
MGEPSETPVTSGCAGLTRDERSAALPLGASLVREDTDATIMTSLGGVPLGPELPISSADGTSASATQRLVRRSASGSATEISSDASADAAMDRFAEGDDAACDDLYRILEPRLYSYAVRMTKNRWQAEDLVSHTFEMICRHRGSFLRGSLCIPWAFAILRNRHRDMHKKKTEELFPEGVHDNVQAGDEPDPYQCTEARQLDQLVRQELMLLPDRQRDVFELHYFGGLTQAEIADLLDLTVPTVKSLVQRARETLRSVFQSSAGSAST